MVGAMPEAAKSRMSIYISEANRRRLARVPRGMKTEIVNEALARVLTDLERRENFDAFLEKIRNIPRVSAPARSEEMVRRLRETGEITLKPTRKK